MLFYNRTIHEIEKFSLKEKIGERKSLSCLLYTSDAADE